MRRALLVGIDAYPTAPLAGCVNDATTMRDLLATHHDGSPNFDCRLLTSPPQAVTAGGLREAATDLLAQSADVALFYFSGHGAVNSLGGHLVCEDSTRWQDGFSMTELLTLANTSQASQIVIILDCCASGAFGQIPALGTAIVHLQEGRCVLTASRSSEAAIESGGSGLFTSLLAGALDGGAADVLGNVSVAGVYAYVDQALGAWDQRPMFMANLSTFTNLRKCPPAVELAILRQLPQWFPSQDADFPLDPSYEPDAEPDDPDHEAVFAKLQKCRAAKLVEPIDEDHMYYAAMRSTGCRLTPLGRYYWRLANDRRI